MQFKRQSKLKLFFKKINITSFFKKKGVYTVLEINKG